MRLGQTSVIHFGSRLVGSITGFVATLYIARELGGSVLGTYFLFAAVLIWLKTLFGSGLHYAIKKRLSETGSGGGELGAGILVQLVVYFIVVVGLLLFRGTVESYLGFNGTWLLAVALVFVLTFSLVSAALHGEQKVHLSALLSPLNLFVRSGIQLAVVFFGLLGGGLVGLIWGYIAGAAVAASAGIILLSIWPLRPSRADVESILNFTRYSWLSGIEERSFSALDTVILGLFVSSNLIAYYEVAWSLASLLAIFGTSLAQTLFPTISQLDSEGNHDEVGSLVTESLAYSGLFLIPGLVGTLLIGDIVLGVYGTEFQKATIVLPILVVARLIYAYEAQLISSLNAIEHPDTAFRVNLVFVCTNLGLNILLVWFYGWVGAAIATTMAASIGFVLAFIALSRIIDFELPSREIGFQWAASALMAGGIYIFDNVITISVSPIINAVVYIALGATIYFLALGAFSRRFRRTVWNNIPS
ncbi:polysaccharide biosynthesis C-terminal domain-containing protein [Halorubrum ezzemoulense]|uniref:lipopolysaccharide biosynthesis protein n=1 Tax=Halorubrum ezzemoulense TaxID=337243 RepID=UPI00232AA481|nr:polysaccharide biosynthesis C-terminal domain-containing protein [Halorubrum ezzemoulense]MDB2250575.1 polysaccharide biosynthesis C-terminal domain-containing protein [Halorubrum ezzemoulense]MDB2285975.1 polysaccharide biosynthesis C-terminal domain-containing protein [Halorubrum ezzemoulense]